jgi:hypothetical protein
MPALQLFLSIIEAGIVIVTLADRQLYSKEKINSDFTPLLISLTIMQRAHEESRTKAMRVAAAWENKRAQKLDLKMTARAPEWLRLSSDRRRFQPIPSRVTIVQRIFEECATGFGKRLTAKNLNRDGICPFRGSHGWGDSSVQKILSNEAVLGRFQPCRLVNGKRVPEGDPVPDYYPQIITEDLYWRARAAMNARRIVGAGRKGLGYANLVSGLAQCGECGSKMVFIRKGELPKGGQYLVCGSARRGICKNSTHFRYDLFEIDLVRLLHTLDLRKIINPVDTVLAGAGKVAALEAQISDYQKRLGNLVEQFETTGINVVADRIRRLNADIEILKVRRDEIATAARIDQAISQTDHDGDVPRAIAAIRFFKETERFKNRAAMAQEFRQVIKEVICFSQDRRVVVGLRSRTKYGAYYVFVRGGFEHLIIDHGDQKNSVKLRGSEIEVIRSVPNVDEWFRSHFEMINAPMG